MSLDEAKAEQILDERAIDAAPVRPVEAVGRRHIADQRGAGPALEVAALAFAVLELDQLLERLDGAEVVLDGMVGQGLVDTAAAPWRSSA